MNLENVDFAGHAFWFIPLVLFAGFFFWLDSEDGKSQKAWQDFASQNAYQYESKSKDTEYPMIRGKIRGLIFTMWEESCSYRKGVPGDYEDAYAVRTRMHLQIQGFPDGLSISKREGELSDNMSAVVDTLTGKRIDNLVKIGNAEFDEKWETRTDNPEAVLIWLQSVNIETLDQILKAKGFDLYEGGIAWTGQTPGTVKEIKELFNSLNDYAKHLKSY